MALNENALTTVATIKSVGYLNLLVDTYDSWIERQINIFSQRIENYLKRKLYTRTITDERYAGSNRSKLYLNNYPITSITSVKQDDETISSSDYELESSDYSAYLYNEYLWKAHGAVRGISNALVDKYEDIEVTYITGYVLPPTATGITLPPDIEEACIQSIIYQYGLIGTNNKVTKSEKLQSWGITYADDIFDKSSGLLSSVKSMLDPYKLVNEL
jgi:hypothetical protein